MNLYALAHRPSAFVFALFLSLLTGRVVAQIRGQADLDPAFRQTFSLYGGEITALALQGDGKILVGGAFERVRSGGTFASGPLVRLNADGTIDSSFRYVPSRSAVKALLVQPDGKVVLGITGGSGIERLLPDGAHDPEFKTYSDFQSRAVTDVVLQPDGKIVAIGSFDRRAFDPDAAFFVSYGIIRFHADGSVDRAFNAEGRGMAFSTAISSIQSVALQADGRILIGGSFPGYNETPRRNLARLNVDGTLDSTFNPGTGPDNSVQSVVLQNDGKILIGGAFQNFNNTPRNRLARLEANGGLDETFNAGTLSSGSSSSPPTIAKILLQATGKILVAGNFQQVNGTARSNLAELNDDGSLDASFTMAADRPVRELLRQLDGKLLLAGSFTRAGGETHFSLARLQADGKVDSGFNPAALSRGIVSFLSEAPGGKIVVAGNFDVVGNVDRPSIVRLNTDSSIDDGFNPAIQILFPSGIATQPDGRIIIAAESLNGFGYQMRQGLVRLRSDGSFDLGYDLGIGGLPSPAPLALQPDGKLLVALSPPMISPPAHLVTRFNPDGSVDSGFHTNLSEVPRQILAHPNGGIFLRFGGTDVTGFAGDLQSGKVARLRADGTNDPDFTPFASSLGPIALEPGNKIVIPYACINLIGSTLWQTVALPTKNSNAGIPLQPCSLASSLSNPVGPYVILTDRTIFSPDSGVARERMSAALLQALQTEIGPVGPTAVLRQSDGGIVIAGNGLLIRAKFPTPAPATSPSLAITSAATYKPEVAAGSLVAVFGRGLSASPIRAVTPSTTLGDTRVVLISDEGQEKDLILLYVSDGQINAQIPESIPIGQATLLVMRSGQAIGSTQVNILKVAPGIFTATSDGQGYAAALALRVKADGSQIYERIVERNAAGQIAPLPIDLGPDGEAVYLVSFGTGIRNHSGSPTAPGNAVKAEVSLPSGTLGATVTYAGEAPGFVGLDQVNILIPRSLKGINSDVTFQLTVDGLKAMSTVRIL